MSYLLKIAGQMSKTENMNADILVSEISENMREIVEASGKNNMEVAIAKFYVMAALAQPVYLTKNTFPGSVQEARDYADMHEFYVETLKESSTIIMAMLIERFGNLVPENAVQKMATYASEEKKLTKKKIERHLKSLMPSPRKKTNDKRGGRR